MIENLEGYLEQHDALTWRQFMIAVKKLADSLNYGTDRSRFLGSGIEYVQSRPYEFGDSVKSIDWRVTARTNEFYVKQYEAPKCLPCYLMFDTSASMTISSHIRSKYATAVHIAGAIAFACLDRISPVGIVSVGSHDLRIEPNLSKHQIMQWLLKLRRFRYDQPTELGRRVAELAPSLQSRAMIIVLSDLHDERALISLKRLSHSHDVVVLQFRDPAERTVSGSGFFRGQEAETGRSFVATGRQEWIDQELIDQTLKRAGVDHLIIDVDQPFVHMLRQFFRGRDLLGRGAR